MRLLFLLYTRPLGGMSRILDEARIGTAVALACGTAVLLSFSMHIAVTSALMAVATVAAAFVPAAIVVLNLMNSSGGVGVVLRSNYAQVLVCTLMGFSAALLPVALAAFVLPAPILVGAGGLYFLFLAGCALYTAMGATVEQVVVSAVVAVGACFVFSLSRGVLYYLASPFVLYYAYFLFASDLQGIGTGLRSRQSFRKHLEAAAINPHDADAQYQLGLIYQQRRQYGEAAERFRKAIAIDKDEPDANYQLARILREQGKFSEALPWLERAVAIDDKLSQSEIWREIGRVRFKLGDDAGALAALGKFVERRAYDPEGLYWYGIVLRKLGREAEAREAFQRCIEAVDTMPAHRVGSVRQWRRLAAAKKV